MAEQKTQKPFGGKPLHTSAPQEGTVSVPKFKSDFNFSQLALAEDELNHLKEKHGLADKPKWWQRLGDWYFAHKENRQKHLVSRKVYLRLCVLTGVVGGHRFYERRWGLGIAYLLLAITALPIAFTVVDWMIAVPMKPDENGMIWI